MSTTCLPAPIILNLNPSSGSCTRIGQGGGSRRASRSSSRCAAMPAQPPCYLHPRNDCNIPCCKPPRKCPEGIYVQRVEPFTPDRKYLPPEIPFNGLTTYRENYYLKCGQKAQSFKPAAQFDPSDASFVGLTSYREQYYPKCAKREKSYKPNVTANFSDSPMRDMSTYRFDYHLKCGEKVESLKPKAQFFPSSAKMDGITTYRSTFIPFCPREYKFAKQPYANKLMSGDFSCKPFEGISTYRVDYWPKPINKQASLKPNVKPRFSDAKMDGCSTYRYDFNPFTFEKCIDNCVPARVYDEMYPRCGLFACGAEPEEAKNKDYEDPCPPPPNCPCGPPPPCDPRMPPTDITGCSLDDDMATQMGNMARMQGGDCC